MDANAYGGEPAPHVRASLEQILDEVEALSQGAGSGAGMPPPNPLVGGMPSPPSSMGEGMPPLQNPMGGGMPPPQNPMVGGTPPPPMSGGGGAAPLLNGLLSNPALLSALPSLMEKMAPLLGAARGAGGGDGVGSGSGGQSGPPGQTGSGNPAAGLPIARPARAGMDRHTALLCAVKPYLNPQRRAAADTMIQLCRVWDALDKSGISLGSLLGGLGGIGGGHNDGRR